MFDAELKKTIDKTKSSEDANGSATPPVSTEFATGKYGQTSLNMHVVGTIVKKIQKSAFRENVHLQRAKYIMFL